MSELMGHPDIESFFWAGLFLTDNADACKRAWFYCRKCHSHVKNEKAVTKCSCKRTAVRMAEKDYRNASRMQKKRHNGADKVIKYMGFFQSWLDFSIFFPVFLSLFSIANKKICILSFLISEYPPIRVAVTVQRTEDSLHAK